MHVLWYSVCLEVGLVGVWLGFILGLRDDGSVTIWSWAFLPMACAWPCSSDVGLPWFYWCLSFALAFGLWSGPHLFVGVARLICVSFCVGLQFGCSPTQKGQGRLLYLNGLWRDKREFCTRYTGFGSRGGFTVGRFCTMFLLRVLP